MKLWIAGGVYTLHEAPLTGIKEFRLVKPTGGLPYVRRTEKAARQLYNLTRHHAHLYSTTVEHPETLLLEQESHECQASGNDPGVAAPPTVTLAGVELTRLVHAIQEETETS